MAYSRIFGVLETELSTHLRFSFSILENLTRPGAGTLRAGDRFRLTAWVTNDSAIPLKSVFGEIAPAALTRFDPIPFQVSRLYPGKRKQIAVIEASVRHDPGGRCLPFNKVGIVNVTIRADLSRFRFEKSRPLTYVRSA